MKQNYILFLFALTTCCFSYGQTTLVDQPVVGTNGIISSFLNDVVLGTYSADDFTLTDNYSIDTIVAHGFGSSGSDIAVNMTGLDIYIYADAAGVPDSDPTAPGTGLLEIINLSPASTAISIVNNVFTVDVTAANGGTELQLGSGTYWLVVAPRAPGDATRWNWFASDLGGNAVLFDEGNFGGLPWTDFISLGLTFDSLAFTVEGTLAPLSIDEFGLTTISIFPNPAKDRITLNLPDAIGDFKTEIYSVIGQLIAQSENKSQLNVSNLNSGIYVLRVTTENGSVTKRFTKR